MRVLWYHPLRCSSQGAPTGMVVSSLWGELACASVVSSPAVLQSRSSPTGVCLAVSSPGVSTPVKFNISGDHGVIFLRRLTIVVGLTPPCGWRARLCECCGTIPCGVPVKELLRGWLSPPYGESSLVRVWYHPLRCSSQGALLRGCVWLSPAQVYLHL